MVAFTVNGWPVEVAGQDDKPLLWVLREDLGILGPKYGCGVAQCGACRVLNDGRSTPSCIVSTESVNGALIVTVEGLSDESGGLSDLLAGGAVEETNFQDYPVQRMAGSPVIEVAILDSDLPPGGAGEPTVVPVAAAIGNAIFAATGRRIRSLPLATTETVGERRIRSVLRDPAA